MPRRKHGPIKRIVDSGVPMKKFEDAFIEHLSAEQDQFMARRKQMNQCCIQHFVMQGIEERFALSPEGTEVTCPECKTVYRITLGKWTKVS